VLLLVLLGTFVTACASAATDGSTTAAGQSACDQAFAQAIAIDADSDTVSAIDGAIAGCPSLEAWVQAAEQHPDAFGGQDLAALATERCAASSQLANTAVCTDLPSN
jgi:ADP-ribosylglycohydrolase